MAIQFRPELAEKVMRGEKTRTRRLANDSDYAVTLDGNTIHCVLKGYQQMRWQVGQIHAVQPGRGKLAVGKIRVVSIRAATMGVISEEDARAEGFANADEFRAYVSALYPKDKEVLEKDCWDIEFEVVSIDESRI